MVQYCYLNIENQKVIAEKAKSKKDGVYSLRGIAYRVKNNKVTHYACQNDIIQPYGNFNVNVGKYVGGCDNATAALKKIEKIVE